MPGLRAAAPICSMHPGLVVATTSGRASIDVGVFATAQFGGHLRLHEVEDAGAAAADVAVGNRHERDAGNRREQVARLLPDALRVGEVAGVMVGDAHVDPMPRRARGLEAGEHLGDVAHLRRERLRALRPTPGSFRNSSP